jgi:hypothetical protein
MALYIRARRAHREGELAISRKNTSIAIKTTL